MVKAFIGTMCRTICFFFHITGERHYLQPTCFTAVIYNNNSAIWRGRKKYKRWPRKSPSRWSGLWRPAHGWKRVFKQSGVNSYTGSVGDEDIDWRRRQAEVWETCYYKARLDDGSCCNWPPVFHCVDHYIHCRHPRIRFTARPVVIKSGFRMKG